MHGYHQTAGVDYFETYNPVVQCSNIFLALPIIISNIYGICRGPKKIFDKIQSGLLEYVFIQYKLYPCIFMKSNMIFLVYVDGTIIYGPDKQAIEAEIKSLGVIYDEHIH